MSPFKANYGYALKTSLSPKQIKKSSKVGKKRAEKLIVLYKELLLILFNIRCGSCFGPMQTTAVM